MTFIDEMAEAERRHKRDGYDLQWCPVDERGRIAEPYRAWCSVSHGVVIEGLVLCERPSDENAEARREAEEWHLQMRAALYDRAIQPIVFASEEEAQEAERKMRGAPPEAPQGSGRLRKSENERWIVRDGQAVLYGRVIEGRLILAYGNSHYRDSDLAAFEREQTKLSPTTKEEAAEFFEGKDDDEH